MQGEMMCQSCNGTGRIPNLRNFYRLSGEKMVKFWKVR